MPTYEYECISCKRRFEIFQRMTEKPLKKCLYCNGKIHRIIGAGAGLIFKGSGFYITDYKKNNTSVPEKRKQPDAIKKTSEEKVNTKSDTQNANKNP